MNSQLAEMDYEVRKVTCELADANRRCEQLENLLLDLREYFEQRADADCDDRGFVANEEMRILMRIEQEL